jgi:hypothetical protein
MTRYLLLFDSYSLLLWGTLSDERMVLSFVYAAGLASTVFLGSESMGLGIISYRLRFEASLFVASYDSWDHGGVSEWTAQKTSLPTVPPLLQDVTNGTDRIENTSKITPLFRWL